MRISPIEAKIFNVKEAQFTIIKDKSSNLLMKSNLMPHGSEIKKDHAACHIGQLDHALKE